MNIIKAWIKNQGAVEKAYICWLYGIFNNEQYTKLINDIANG